MDYSKELWGMRIFSLELQCECRGKDETRPSDEHYFLVKAEQDVVDSKYYHSSFKHWFEAATLDEAISELKRRSALVAAIGAASQG